MNIKVLDDQGNDVIQQEKPVEFDTPPGLEQGENILRNEVAELFDFKPTDTKMYRQKLDTIIEYAKTKTDDHSPQGIKWAVRSLGLKLGTPPLAEKLVEYLYRYAYLALEGNRIDEQKQRFLNGNAR